MEICHGATFGFWAPLGTFMWRRRELFEAFRKEIEQAGAEWKPLKAGFFGGSPDRALEMLKGLTEFTARVRGQLGVW